MGVAADVAGLVLGDHDMAVGVVYGDGARTYAATLLGRRQEVAAG